LIDISGTWQEACLPLIQETQTANVEKTSVALTPEMANMMREVVSSGECACASQVMREALRDWKHRRKQRDEAINELRRRLDES
jgi:antitoxin ParD1/3/4